MDMLTIDQVYEPDALERERRLERLADPYRLWEAGDALTELKRLQAESPDAFALCINRRAIEGVVDVLLNEIQLIKKEAVLTT